MFRVSGLGLRGLAALAGSALGIYIYMFFSFIGFLRTLYTHIIPEGSISSRVGCLGLGLRGLRFRV